MLIMKTTTKQTKSEKVTNVTFAKDAQKMIGDALLANAKTIGGIKYLEIPISMLTIDHAYQRPSKRHVKSIAAKWDKNKAGVLIVSYRDSNFYIIDGQHRYLAAQIVGEENMTCQVYENLTIEQEAEKFGSQKENVVNLSTIDTFRANLVAKHQQEVDILKLCKKYNITILPTDKNEKPVLRALKSVESSYKTYGKECLEFTFDIIKKAGWHNEKNAYSKPMIIALRNIYASHNDNVNYAQNMIIQLLEHINYDLLKSRACCTYIGREDSSALTAMFEKYISSNGVIETQRAMC
jgi:hypothetical protein